MPCGYKSEVSSRQPRVDPDSRGRLCATGNFSGQGQTVAKEIKSIGVSKVTYYCWRQEKGGMSTSQAKRLKDLEKENAGLRKAASDLTFDKLILHRKRSREFSKP